MTQKTKISRWKPSPGRNTRQQAGGFTLIELAVALTVILLIVSMVVPTLTKMLSSRSAEEAFNLVAAQLTAARAEAISADTYAGIHVQLGAGEDIKDSAYSMVIMIEPETEILKDNPVFTRHPDFLPHELPGGTAMGELTDDFVRDNTTSTGSGQSAQQETSGEYKNIGTEANLQDFCAFSIVFSPDGSVATQVKDGKVMFSSSDPMFTGNTKLWEHSYANNEPGIMAFTMFDYRKLEKLESADRVTFLNETGQFLPVNMHTGQLFDRQ